VESGLERSGKVWSTKLNPIVSLMLYTHDAEHHRGTWHQAPDRLVRIGISVRDPSGGRVENAKGTMRLCPWLGLQGTDQSQAHPPTYYHPPDVISD